MKRWPLGGVLVQDLIDVEDSLYHDKIPYAKGSCFGCLLCEMKH